MKEIASFSVDGHKEEAEGGGRDEEMSGTDDLFGGGIDNGDALAQDRLPPFTVDEELARWDRDRRHDLSVYRGRVKELSLVPNRKRDKKTGGGTRVKVAHILDFFFFN